MFSYTYRVYKTLEIDGVRYFFSRNAWNDFVKDAERYDLDMNDLCNLLQYSTDFEVI